MDVELDTIKADAEQFRKSLAEIGVGLKTTYAANGKLCMFMYRHDDGRETGMYLIEELTPEEEESKMVFGPNFREIVAQKARERRLEQSASGAKQ